MAIAWLDAIDNEFALLEREGKPTRPLNQALTLKEDQTIEWQEDKRWNQLMDIVKVLPGEGSHHFLPITADSNSFSLNLGDRRHGHERQEYCYN